MVVFTLTLVRHGETVANRKNIIQGQKDWHLSPTGLDQVRLVAGRLQNEKFTHVFASDLNRAAETAKVIVENNKCCERIVIVHDKRLRERKFGVVEGKNYRELVSAAKKINASVANYTPTGAETLQQIQERAKSFFRDLCEQVRKSGHVEDGNYTPAPIKRRYEDAIDGCLHEQELHPASADTVDGITPNQNQTASSQPEEDSEHKRRRHAHNKTQKQQLDSNKELLLNKGVTNQGQILHECPASKIDDKTCTTKNSESLACAAGEASVVSNEKLGAKAITGAGGDKEAVNEKCKAISGNVANNQGSNHFNSFTPCNSTAALTLSVDVPIHSVQPTSLAAPSSISKMGSSSTIAQSSKALNPINGVAINGVASSGPSLSSQSNTQNENGATFNNGNVANSTGDGNMKRSNSLSSSGFSSLQEENELLDSDDNSITALEEGNYNNNSSNDQQEDDDNDDDDDEDDDDDFCSKDSDSCYDSPFTVPVSDADVRGNIPCPKSTKYGCPNVSLSPLLEHRHSNFSSMSSGRSSSFDDGDSCHQNVADVLIVSHGGFLKELIRLFIDELECKFPGGKGHALRLSPNTGVSKFTITVGEPNKILVTCLLIHDKDHLLSAGLNSCLPINAVSVLPTGYLHVSKRSPLNISSTNGLPPTPSLSLPAMLGSSYVRDPKPSLSGKSCPSLSSPVPSISSSSLLSSSK